MLTVEKEKEYAETLRGMIKFLESLGLTVNTKTKARGHQGFFLNNRIDISNSLSNERKIEVLIHEFSHYIHAKIDPFVYKNHGNLKALFPGDDIEQIEEEMVEVTKFVDTNSTMHKLKEQRERVLEEIKLLSGKIKIKYPDFKRSTPYKKIEGVIKRTDAKYLLKYDRVKIKAMFLGKNAEYSIKTIDTDFPQFEEEIKDYIRLKSFQRTLKRVASRISKLKAYYRRPSELFARFVEALFIDTTEVSKIAPYAYLCFCKHLTLDKYPELAEFINKFF